MKIRTVIQFLFGAHLQQRKVAATISLETTIISIYSPPYIIFQQYKWYILSPRRFVPDYIAMQTIFLPIAVDEPQPTTKTN